MASNYFNFEDKEFDFPLYKKDNIITGKTGIILILSLIIFIFLIIGPVKFHNIQEQFILFFVMFIPFLYVTKGRIATLFRMPKLNDIKIILYCTFGNFALLFLVTFIVTMINYIAPIGTFAGADTSTVGYGLDALSLIANFFQIISEELVRITVFLLILHVIYKYTNNRKNSIIAAVIISLLLFGLLHINIGRGLVYAVVCIGFCSYFTLHAYLKTKNATLSVLVHLLYNVITILILSMV